MATVYLARDLRHDRPVAVKVFRPELTGLVGPDRFLREIAIAAHLGHPNILPLHDSGDHAGLLYYVMPFVPGETLRERLRREGQLPVADAVRIARDVAEALAYAHGHGIVHRDVKPENILLEGAHAYVADFGIARAIGLSGADTITGRGIAVGTGTYMSPEQATSSDLIDGRSDQYALACVVYEMLAGTPPFTAPTVGAVLAQQINEEPPPLRASRPNLDEALDRAVLTALAKLPADRYPTTTAFADALERAIAPATTGRGPGPSRGTTWLAGIAIALAAVALLLAVRRQGGLARDATSSSRASVPVLVVPFDIGDGAVDSTQRASAARLLATGLEAFPVIDAVDGARLLAGTTARAAGIDSLTRAARRLGARYVVTGLVGPDRRGVQLSVDLHAIDGTRLSRTVVTAAGTSLDAAIDSAALRVIRAIADRDRLAAVGRGSVLASTNSARALGHLVEGQRRFWRSDLDGAEEEYAKAIEADSSCALAWHRLSVAHLWKYDYAGAARVAEAGLARAGEEHWRELLRAQRHYARREADSALALFQRNVLDLPGNVDGWMGLGEVLVHMGWFVGHAPMEARTPFQKLVRLDSTFAPIQYHLFDIAYHEGDTVAARVALAALRADNPYVPPRRLLVDLVRGDPMRRRRALDTLARADRFVLSEMAFVGGRMPFDAAVVDTIAGLLMGSGRTPDDRLRGADYRLVARLARGDTASAFAEWTRVAPPATVDGWMGQAWLAGFDSGDIHEVMFERARWMVLDGPPIDFTRSYDHESLQALMLLAHRAVVDGDAARVRALLSRIDAGAPRADPTDPLPSGLRHALEGRLALLAGDTVAGIAHLERSLARVAEPYTAFVPLTSMATERLLLAELLIARDPQRARRWLDTFDHSPSIADAMFTRRVRELRDRLSSRPSS